MNQSSDQHSAGQPPEGSQTDSKSNPLQSCFLSTTDQVREQRQGSDRHREFTGKEVQKPFFMRSVMDPNHGIDIDRTCPLERVVLSLLDCNCVQRLNDIKQIGGAVRVFPDATHYRFGHSIGVGMLTARVLNSIRMHSTDPHVLKQIEEWGPVVVAFGVLHDIGHVAPGSHIAQKVWFPKEKDAHEEISRRIVKHDGGLREVLNSVIGEGAAEKLDSIMSECPSVPRWTWQLITAGGWNVDRGDWVGRDSLMCGVNYGTNDQVIIIKGLRIHPTPDGAAGELVMLERCVGALKPFFSGRTALYENVYGHPVARIYEMMCVQVGERARSLYRAGNLSFADDGMQAVLAADASVQVPLEHLMNMDESWFRNHLKSWAKEEDVALRELSCEILNRRSFKQVPLTDENRELLRKLVRESGREEAFAMMELSEHTINFERDLNKAPSVMCANGSLVPLIEYSDTMRKLAELKQIKLEGILAVSLSICKNLPVRH
ncbi:MAG: HD domain-containing protein [Proteobacteria bacterium]|nr:HD domain-containing protein [Pseudomonadota bacterium]